MAKHSVRDELVQSCRSTKPVDDREKIATGQTLWFEGKPAPAEKGMIALDTASGARIVVREEDVRSAENGERGYLVEVVKGADVIVRVEQVVKAEPKSCGCHENDSPQAAQRINGGPIIWHRFCWTTVEYICSYVTDSRGVGRIICIPVLVHQCQTIPIGTR